jgi:RHS repeat-associated protein
VVEGGQVFFIRTDHIGRPVFATNDLGVKVWEASYLPFGGVQTATVVIDLRFHGKWLQSESGMKQNWMRDYDPTTGRYIQADPLGLVDGASVYGYALQNPGRYVDPRGEYAGAVAFCFTPMGALACGGGAAAVALYYIYLDDIVQACGILIDELDSILVEKKSSSKVGGTSVGRKGGAASGERTKAHRKGKRKSTSQKHTKRGAGVRSKSRNNPNFKQR